MTAELLGNNNSVIIETRSAVATSHLQKVAL
ncbi:hypothetical protein ACP_1930 [Acidobacterium capsulatum ATCC 51196]|uniref:Uncharacterized protein n=1 Tax=Acidobacterium capsulatum (strain ATCC 51196 / DSM 11244 / BCRC 80197 / JCM 7670 / NBRC 15755 / NCIMB 13165 / 161) TaxID=240015 RepID=C1F8B9_ACIC5|nr:hypothetical protein ACP_1930 [Acidobacterium capsulatum ATCC 51196]